MIIHIKVIGQDNKVMGHDDAEGEGEEWNREGQNGNEMQVEDEPTQLPQLQEPHSFKMEGTSSLAQVHFDSAFLQSLPNLQVKVASL